MRIRQRFLSLLLAGALLLPALPPARAEEPSDTGEVGATLRVDWPQTLETLRDRNIRAELFQDDRSLGDLSLTEDGETFLGGYPAAVSLRNTDGGSLEGGRWPGYLDLSVSGLPRGNYALEFSGYGYTAYRQELSLQDCSRHVILGTSDDAFTLGDVDGDGRMSNRDREELSQALGSSDRRDLEEYDLNGDGTIDIYDLAILSRNLKATGRPELLDTRVLAPAVEDIRLGEGVRLLSGTTEDLFREGGQPVVLESSGGPVSLQATLAGTVEARQIRIVSPQGPGAPLEGQVDVTYDNGETERFPFDLSRPEGVRAIGPEEGRSTVVISLGRRVAVKEITITVTRSEDGSYTTVESIQFLRDIVPENPTPAGRQVRNLTAAAGNAQVSLRWTELPNVSGYRVDYWLENNEAGRKSIRVNVPRAEITGLENLKTYYFTVTPVDDGWEGDPCTPVSATPQPAKAPAAPDMVSVGELDGALSVSWKASEGATFYELWYKAESDADYRRWGGQLSKTSDVINSLTNGVTYSIYIIAGNDVGASGPSRIAQGTPAATDYSRPEGIPTQGVLEGADIEKVWLADSGNVSSSYPASAPFQPSFMADGDFRTHWTSQAWGDGNFARSKTVYASFRQPVDLSSVIWVPRLDGGYPNNLRVYTVTVWREGEDLSGPGTLVAPDPLRGGSGTDTDTWLPVGNRPGTTKFAVLPFEPVTDVVKIAVTIEQMSYTAVSLSELMFLEYDPARCLPDNIAALFGDGLRTTLRSGVTQAEIDVLRTRLSGDERNYYLNPTVLDDELDLAEELLAGASSGVVLRGVDSRDTGADSGTYGQSGSALQPLGAAAGAGQEITIYAEGIPAGQTVTVYATQYNAEASTWRAQAGTLVNGRNILTIPKIGSQNTPRGGSLYLTYSGPNPEGIRLHVRRAVSIPCLDLSDWRTLSDSQRRAALDTYAAALEAYASKLTGDTGTNWRNVTEIATPDVLLSLPAAAVLNGAGRSRAERVETLYQTVLAWAEVMQICKTTQGIDDSRAPMQSRQNIRCMQMFSGAFMYAAGNHIGIGYGSCAGMVCGKPVSALESGAQANRLFGWGIAHEIGHNMDKLGKAEITNNLYALMVQTYDGAENVLPSRLEKSGKYEKIFTKTAQALPGDSNDVFVQLGLYWQLHLAYDGGDAPLDFYNRFFQAWKAKTWFGGETGYQDRVARTASAVAQRNLTEFFTRWGMTLSDGTKAALAAYPAEDRALWYLSDQSRRDRLENAPAGRGTVSATAAVEGESTVVLTIASTLEQGVLQGYEILRDGRSIGFTSEGTYTDEIGSANHRTYTYSVRAYDRQGNCFARSEDKEIRIAYDKTVDPAAYTVERAGTTLTFTLKEETPVSGLKLTGANRPITGEYSVSITAGNKTTTALTGDFSQGNQAVDDRDSYLAYFRKPGAAEGDTRLWTYDAQTIVVTGIPADMKTEEVRLVRYAGDDVAFLEAGCVGLLAEEYRYGDGANQVLPAGTLVVAGSYRGNPLYQTVRLEGRFTRTVLDEKGEVSETTESRPISGKALLFAEVPEDGEVSDISDGLFLFVPDVQREAELQGEISSCAGENLLPAQMRAVLSRTDMPDATDSQRVTAQTLWIHSPGGEDLPVIVLEEGE